MSALGDLAQREAHPTDGTCWCDEISQETRAVHKHSHVDEQPCTRPWSALCQTQHGDICHASDHESQPEALAALCAHLAKGSHIAPGSGDQPQQEQTACRAAVAALTGKADGA